MLLVLFAVCKTAFLAVDGLAVGVLAGSDPSAADALWTSPMVDALADLTGAAWAAALLARAAQLYPAEEPPAVIVVESALTWAGRSVQARNSARGSSDNGSNACRSYA